MRRLILFGLALLFTASLQAQQRTRSPHGDLKTECKTCHRSDAWTPVRISKEFDHSKFSFPLAGAHSTVTCRACHQALDFKGAKSDCVSCHEDKHRGELGANCARCHTTRSFLDREVMTKAHQLTRFPLEGGHRGVDCAGCHKPGAQGSLQFVGTRSECVSCHKSNYDVAPNHLAGNFPIACAGCHSQVAWNRGVGGNHPTTPIALTGVHANRQCTDCHVAQGYSAVKQTCDGCHHADFAGTANPNHQAAGFSINCTDCHGLVAGWANASYTGHPSSPLALTNAHTLSRVSCTQCHITSPYSTVQSTCVGCHQADYDLSADPPHKAGQFSTTCTTCHNTTTWQASTFVHSASPISLAGAHGGVTCTQCHTTTPYSTVKTTCDGCHHADYSATNSPSHTAAGYSTDCASCHQVVANWAGASVNHPTSPIALTGVHANKQCSDCHLAGQAYAAVKQTCDGCHHTDYAGTANPNHQAAGFSINCTDCHGLVAGWANATYTSHPTSPINPKQGPHGAATCSDCHTTTPYSTVKNTCDGCHHPDYVATSNPNHTAAGYSTDCASCHQVVAGWAGATVNHPTSPLTLTGVHNGTAISCAQCHTTMPYSAVKQTCDGCHHTDFTASADPNHVMASFLVTCTDCHALVAGWTGAKFTAHDGSVSQFLIYSGRHKARWSQCSDCHKLGQVYSNTAQLLCLNCHGEVQTGQHRGKNYTPTDCVRSGCHANGSAN